MKVLLRWKEKGSRIKEKVIQTKTKAIYLAHSNTILKNKWEWAEVWHLEGYLYFDSRDYKK